MALLRSEWPFFLLLAVAAALRVVVLVAFRPALWFYGDSFGYLNIALRPVPYDVRPVGYSFFLRMLRPLHRLEVVAATQHLVGLAVGSGVYVLLRRFRLPRWAALAGAAPVLLDAYQLELEHLLMADTLFLGLVAVALALLIARDRPSPAACAWVGFLLSLAALTRTIGLVLIVPTVGYLAVRRVGASRIALAVAFFVVPLYWYSSWFAAVHGRHALTASDGFFLYGRVMSFASCTGLSLSAVERRLCDPLPPARRPGLEFYIWDPRSPAQQLPGQRIDQNEVLRNFAAKVIRAQPVDYARAVLTDLGHAVHPMRGEYPSPFTYGNYRFSTTVVELPEYVVRDAHDYQEGRDGRTRPVPSLARELIRYQDLVYVRGPLYLGAAVLAAAGLIAARRRAAADSAGTAAAALLLLTSGLSLIVVPILVQGFDYRYTLPAVPMLGAAAALGGRLLTAGQR